MTSNSTSDPTVLAESRTGPIAEPSLKSCKLALLRWGWPLLYVATVAAVIWWYEFRPARGGSSSLQGTWQAVEGVPPDERPVDSYLHVDGEETWFAYDRYGEWAARRSRVSLRPAENFFVVHRTYGFDYGRPDYTEHFIYLKNDTLYEIRGLADLDPVNEHEVRKLRRTDSLSNEAQTAIHDYVERLRVKQQASDPPRP